MSTPVSSLRMMVIMTLVAAISGAMIVSAYLYTAPMIKKNQDQVVREAAMAVCPGAVRMETIVDSLTGSHFFISYDKQNVATAVALEAQGQGFADQIKVLYAYSPVAHQVIGFKVVESKETPGIGDKINFDTSFLANFTNLDVTQTIVSVKHGKKIHPWQIDGITGATISSNAVAKLMQKSSAQRLRAIDAYWEAKYGN